MHIESVSLHHIEMELKTPFVTSASTTKNRELIIVEMKDKDGVIGWGECSAFASPWYTEETIQTAWHMLNDFLVPLVLNKRIEHPNDVQMLFQNIKRNNMAKASIEGAIWDVYAKRKNQPLSKLLGGNKYKIEVGAAIGIQENELTLLNTIEQYIEQGYKRIKVKIKRGMENAILSPIRKHFPSLALMVDANSDYTLHDIDLLKRLDHYNLLMIEQPLAANDFVEHAQLQKQLKTPICLDESINSYHDAFQAIQLKSCQMIAIKVAKVGGLTASKQIHDLCKAKNIPVWCGGMLDSGIGRAHNIAISSLDNFTLPGDTSASSRYWDRDIIVPEVTMNDGFISVPTNAGIGYEIDRKALTAFTLKSTTIT
ncbi:o-succinylbenzoate synthase [Pueribacillus sp. YX66]|uniref:o-succinylbenzoate synthase n=1 Tax=Pueribacillus sp. YX66 TaxID=3229242 RepID=UPI00358D5078